MIQFHLCAAVSQFRASTQGPWSALIIKVIYNTCALLGLAT